MSDDARHDRTSLIELALAISQASDRDDLLQAAIDGLNAILDSAQVSAFVFGPAAGRAVVAAEQASPAHESRVGADLPLRDSPLMDRLLHSAGPLQLEADLLLRDVGPFLLERQARPVLATPIRVEEAVRGFILCAGSRRSRSYPPDMVELVRTVAQLVAVRLEQIHALASEREARRKAEQHTDSLREREYQLSVLNAIRRATINLDTQEMLQTAVDRLGEMSGADGCYVTLWDAGASIPIPGAAYGPHRESYRDLQVDEGDETLTAAALDAGETLFVEEAAGLRLGLSTQLPDFPVESAMIAPMLSGQEKLGALIIIYGKQHHFTAPERALFEQAADQIALALSKARLFDATRRQLEELKVVHALATAGAAAASEDDLLEEATRILGNTFYPDNFGVLLRDKEGILRPHRSYQIAGIKRKDIEIPLGAGICGRVALSGKPLRTSDVHQETGYLRYDPETLSEVCVPLKSGDQIFGVVNAESKRRNAFTEADERLLATFASQLATAIEKLRLLEAERRRRREAETVREATSALTETLDLDQVLDRILVHLESVVPYGSADVFLLRNDQLHVVASRGVLAEPDLIGETYPADDLLFTELRKRRTPLFLEDAQRDPRFHNWGMTESRSWMGVPLTVQDEVIGCLTLNDRRIGVYGEAEAAQAQTFASQAAIAVKNAALFKAVQRSAGDLEAASGILRSLNATPDVYEAFPSVAAGLRAITGCYRVSLARLNKRGDAFAILALDQPQHDAGPLVWHPLSHTTAADDVLAGRTHLTPDLSQEKEGFFEGMLYESGQRSRLNLPLQVGDTVIGALNLTWERVHGYEEEQLPLLRQVADAVALAVERSRLFEQTETNLAETQALYQVSRALIAADTLPSLLQALVESVAERLPADRVLLVTVDEEARCVVDYVVNEDGEVEFERASFEELWQGLTGWVLRRGEPALSPEGQPDPRESAHIQQQRQASNAGSVVVVPLQYREKVLGTLTAINRQGDPVYTQRNVDLMVAMANQAAVAIENARLFAETQQRASDLEALVDVSSALRVASGTAKILEIALDASMNLFDAERGAIAVPTDPPDRFVIAHEEGWQPSLRDFEYHADDSIFGHVFTSGEPYLARDVMRDERAHRPTLQAWRSKTSVPHTSIFAPLRAGEHVVGIISLTAGDSQAFDEEDVRMLTAVAEIAGSALQRTTLTETLEQRVAERTRELEEAYEQLKELDRLKSKFVSDISHELRTPITSLTLYMDLIEHGNFDQEKRYWTVLRKQAERLNRLIEDILNLSRLELRDVEESFAAVDLNVLVENRLQAYQAEVDAAGLRLHFEPDEARPMIWGQREHLAQIVDNLLANAIHYTAEGYIRVTTYLDRDQGEGVVSIKDTGQGIGSDDLPHVFERFYRGARTGQSNIPGTGLGLAIVEEVINLHEGRIEVESREGEGTTVTVWLPLAPS